MNDRARQISAPLARGRAASPFLRRAWSWSACCCTGSRRFRRRWPSTCSSSPSCRRALALLVGLIALAQIWHSGYAGAGGAAIGILLPLLMAAWPLAYVQPTETPRHQRRDRPI
jgi:hypothetical protein